MNHPLLVRLVKNNTKQLLKVLQTLCIIGDCVREESEVRYTDAPEFNIGQMVGLSVCHNFLKGREVTCYYQSTC